MVQSGFFGFWEKADQLRPLSIKKPEYGQSTTVDAHPILLLLTKLAQSESLPLDWVENVATEFTTPLTLIDERWMSAKDEYINCLVFNLI